MCVAVLVESEAPTQVEMWQMDNENPHGIGIAWASNDIIRYKKGLGWMEAYKLLESVPRPALLHFRWATHGGRARHLAHPFPLGPKAVTSRKLNGGAKSVLIHNGTWNDYTKFAPLGIDIAKWSDTAVAAYVAGTIGEEILDHVPWCTAVGRAAGSGRMDVTLRGDWTEHNGNMYSNMYWQPYSLRSNYAYGWRDDGKLVESQVIDIKEYEYDRRLRRLLASESGEMSQWLDEYEAAANAKAGDK